MTAEVRSFSSAQVLETEANRWLKAHDEAIKCLKALVCSLESMVVCNELPANVLDYEIVRRSKNAISECERI